MKELPSFPKRMLFLVKSANSNFALITAFFFFYIFLSQPFLVLLQSIIKHLNFRTPHLMFIRPKKNSHFSPSKSISDYESLSHKHIFHH